MRAAEVLATTATVAVLVMAGCSQKKQQGAEVGGNASKAQTTCPVMEGNPINKNLYADHNGKRVYFCCGACVDAFKADPEKYIRKLEDAGVVLENAPTAEVWTCPMHPHVGEDAPGKCLVCKMDLVLAGKAGRAGARHRGEGMHHGE